MNQRSRSKVSVIGILSLLLVSVFFVSAPLHAAVKATPPGMINSVLDRFRRISWEQRLFTNISPLLTQAGLLMRLLPRRILRPHSKQTSVSSKRRKRLASKQSLTPRPMTRVAVIPNYTKPWPGRPGLISSAPPAFIQRRKVPPPTGRPG